MRVQKLSNITFAFAHCILCDLVLCVLFFLRIESSCGRCCWPHVVAYWLLVSSSKAIAKVWDFATWTDSGPGKLEEIDSLWVEISKAQHGNGVFIQIIFGEEEK